MASGETEDFQCDPYTGATVDTQAGTSELDSTIITSVETEALEHNSIPSTTTGDVNAQTGESKDDGSTMASAETEAFELDPYGVGLVDAQAIGSMHDGIIMVSDLDPHARVSVDTVETQAGGGEHDSSIVGFGETEGFNCGLHATASVRTADLHADGNRFSTVIVSAEREALECDPVTMASVRSVDVQEGGCEHNGTVILSAERETLKCDPHATASVDTVDMQASGSEQDVTMMVSVETEASDCKPSATSAADFRVSVEGDHLTTSSRAQYVQQEANLLLGDDQDSVTVLGSITHLETLVTTSMNTVSNQEGSLGPASPAVKKEDGKFEQDVTMMVLVETEASGCNPSATSAADFRVSVEGGHAATSPRAQYVRQEANSVFGDDQDSVTVLDSIAHLETLVTPSMNTVSNQEGSLGPASPAVEKEDGKFEQVIVHNMEKSQGEVHVFDIGEFDMGTHEVPMTETSFDKHCMFPALDADKSDWHAARDDVIIEDNSLEHDRDHHDAKSMSIETNSNVVVNHDVGENVATEERETQSQRSSEAVPMDAVHGLEEASGFKSIMASHVQGHVNAGGFQCCELDTGNVQGSASGVVQGEKLLYNVPDDVGAQDISLQCDADDIFTSLPGENVEIAHAEGGYDTRISEDNNNGVLEVENEAIQSYQFDQDLPCTSSDLGVENTNSDTVSNDEELQRKAQTTVVESQTTVVGSRMEACKSHEEGPIQAEIQDEGASQGCAPSAIAIEKDEFTDLQSNEIGVCEQSVEVGKGADLSDFKGDASTNSPSEESSLVIACSEISIQVVSQSLAQEETVTPYQNVTHDEAMLNNNKLKVAHVVSHMEADTLQKEQAEKQGGDPLLTGGKSVGEFDVTVLDRRQSDGGAIVKDRDAVAEDKVAGSEQKNEAINGQQQELCLRQPLDTCPPQAEIGKEAVSQDLSMRMTTHLFSSSGPGTDVEGLNAGEKSALQGSEPCEDSREKKHRDSFEDAEKLSKKLLEKHIGDHKSPRAKGLKKLGSSILKAKQGVGEKSGKETSDDSCSSEHEEELSERKPQKSYKEGNSFGIGDLVWARVRSHPWWPAQIFDPADASKSARKAKKSGRVLVAFFGDCTFAWLQQSQMIAFCPNFKEKVKQTTMRIFCVAVEEALEELCRRSELGLSCTHYKGSLHCTSSFPDANAGIREGVRVKRHNDIRASVQMFRPDKTLEFVKGMACSPLGAWSSTLQSAELRGHAYGLRTCMVASGSLDTAPLLPIISMAPSQESKLKRSYSSLISEVAGGSDKEAKRMTSGKEKRASDGKSPSQISKRLKMAIVNDSDQTVENKSVVRSSLDASEGNRDRLSIKFKVSKKTEPDRLPGFERLSDASAGQEVGSEGSSDDGGETLLAFAGKSGKVLNRSSLKEDADSGSIKKKVRRKTVGKSQNRANRAGAPDTDAPASTRTEPCTEDVAFALSSSLAEERVLNAEVIRGKGKKKLINVASSPVSSIDAEDVQEETQKTKRSTVLKRGSRDEMNKAKLAKTSDEDEMRKDMSGNDKDLGKREAVRKFSKMGDSIRKVAGELTGIPVAKSVNDSSTKSTRPGAKKKLKVSALEPPPSPTPTPKKIASRKSTEDVNLLQLRQDLELLTNKAGSGGGSGKTVKHLKKVEQVEGVATKSSPHWQNVPHRSQRSCVQELALAARKRKSEIAHDEVLAKLPKNSSTAGSGRHHTSKAYITIAEKPVERRSFDKNLLHYSRRPAPPASNAKSSSQRYDEKLSSHMPLGLFMRFPEDFPLPSESQLKATFIPFGPLQMSATRLYKDTASAQVVFKHGRDAESALKHAKKNDMFGQVAVTYRLRYLSHSTRVETKTDAPSPNKAHSSQTAPGRKASSFKEKAKGPSASSENRAGDKAQDAAVCESEPTGDIQDQMMTLLRQVSVIVNPVNSSPVPSHDT